MYYRVGLFFGDAFWSGAQGLHGARYAWDIFENLRQDEKKIEADPNQKLEGTPLSC